MRSKTLTMALVIGGMLIGSAAQATTISLITAGATGSGTADLGGTFYVEQIPDQSTGTGVLEPFVRIQASQSGPTEQGYNTGLTPQMDTKNGTFTQALLLSSLIPVTVNNQSYYEFVLDIGQDQGGNTPPPDEYLSLNQIQFFQSTSDRNDLTATPDPADATSTPVASFPTAGTTEVFRLNSGSYDGSGSGGSTIQLNAALNSGNGSGDMVLFISASLFNPRSGQYLIMYSQFGDPPGANATNDGPEEWAQITGNAVDPCLGTTCGGGDHLSPVPEPASMLLFGTGLFAIGARYRRRKQ